MPTAMATTRPIHPAHRPVRHKSDERVDCVDSPQSEPQTGTTVIAHYVLEFRRRVRPLPRWLPTAVYGFLYWLLFLLVLEPDNVLRASEIGYSLPFGREVTRIVGAALLGAAAAPVQTMLSRRVPLMGTHSRRHAAIHLVGNACLAFVLIVASCLLAAWGFERHFMPSLVEVRNQLTANWTLLVFALCAFTAITHLTRLLRCTDEGTTTSAIRERAPRIPIKTGGRLRFVDQASIDWMETQGNYLALHAGSNVQLVRRTLTDFEAELDESRFVRIHRRMIVAVDRIQEMKSLPNGDASLRLLNGHELRVSRRYREAVVMRWGRR